MLDKDEHLCDCEISSKCNMDDLLGHLENDEVVYNATQIFDALSDFTRFQILGALVQGEKMVSELVSICHVSQSAISHQLRLLRDRGLVMATRSGQRVRYSLTDDHVALLIGIGLQHASEGDREQSE